MRTSIVSTRRRRAGSAVVLALVLAVAAWLPASPARAAATPAGPAATAAAALPQAYGTNVTIQGHGFGHGEGMGQYGAYGYATTLGWTWQQILAHYYGGTTLTTTAPGTVLSVRLQALDDRPFTAMVQDKGLLLTNVDGGVNRFRSLAAVETTPGVYALYGRFDTTVCPSYAVPFDPAGWTLIHGNYTSSLASGQFLDVDTSFPDRATADATNLVGLCQPDGAVTYYRGVMRVLNGSSFENRTVNYVPQELYVRGVVPREMPASWGTAAGGAGMHALRVQAVAARSFGLAGGQRYPYAKLCDSQSCQVYGGAAKRAAVGAALTALEATTSTNATNETANVVLVRGGAIVSAMYSSSTGGITAGVAFPSVVDEGDVVSPHHSWSVDVAVATIQAKWPAIGQLRSIDVTRRNGRGEWGGRVLDLVLAGSAGSVPLTGDQFRIGLGLKSTWFFVPSGCEGRVGGTPVPTPTASAFNPVQPLRVVDTRSGLNAPTGPVATGCVLPVRLAGQGGLPASGATVAAVNLTIVNPAGAGFATLYPCAGGLPVVSNVNFVPGDVVANLATVALDGDGYVCVYVSSAAHVLLDVMGWYGGTTAEQFRAVSPVRLRDTRTTSGGTGRVPAGGVLTVSPSAGVPAGVTVRAVALNVTVTNPVAAGFVTAFPCGAAVPVTSNGNFGPGQTRATQVVVLVGGASSACIFTSVATDLIVDLLGWYGPAGSPGGSLFTAVAPTRLLDTRNGTGVPTTTLVPAGGTVALGVAGKAGVPTGAKSVVMNVTATGGPAAGYVTAHPCGSPRPLASNLNPWPGRATANQVMVGLGGGSVCLFTSAPSHLLADVAGSFS